MTASAHNAQAAYDADRFDDGRGDDSAATYRHEPRYYYADEHWDIQPEDRIGPPLAGRRRKLLARGAMLAIVALAAGWALRDGQSFRAAVEAVTTAATGVAQTLMERREVKAVGPQEASQKDAPLPPLAERSVADTPPQAAAGDPHPGSAAEPAAATAAVAEGEPQPDAAPPEPLPPPPPASQLQPYQKRAAGVGLHTDLSRVLLESLTEADYRNAGTAIRTAIAEKDDTTVLIWPRQATPGLAQFQVHFVRGAPGCRRYVVTIAKSGWLTTAQPLERCGARRAAASRE